MLYIIIIIIYNIYIAHYLIKITISLNMVKKLNRAIKLSIEYMYNNKISTSETMFDPKKMEKGQEHR
jgi:hypothetical protein